MHRVVPASVNRTAEESVPAGIQTPTAAHHIVITRNDGLRFGLVGIHAHEETYVVLAGQEDPARNHRLGLLAGAGQDFRRAQLVGSGPIVIRPPCGILAATEGDRHLPGKFITVIIRPDAEAQGDLFELIDALGPLRLGLGAGQGGKEETGQNGDDGNDHQKFNQSEPGTFVCSQGCHEWHEVTDPGSFVNL